MIFRQAIMVTRPSGSYTLGRWIPGTSTIMNIFASVQPATGKQLEALDEGRRNSNAYMLYTNTELRIADAPNGINCDIVTVFGEKYEVAKVQKWSNGILPHYEALVTKAIQ